MNSLRLRAQRRELAGRSSSLRKRVCAHSLLRTFAQLRLASILPTRPTLEPRSLFPRKLLARAISRPRNELRAQFGGKNLALGEHLVLFLSRALRRTEKALNPIFYGSDRPLGAAWTVECVSPASFPSSLCGFSRSLQVGTRRLVFGGVELCNFFCEICSLHPGSTEECRS